MSECTRHSLPFGRPEANAPTQVHVVSCAHIDNKFVVAIEGYIYRFVDFVEDLPNGDVNVEFLAALAVPVSEEAAREAWEGAETILRSGRGPI